MEGDHVGLGVEGIQVHILSDLPAGIVGVQVIGQHLHAHGLGDAPLGLANAAEADNANGLALQLDEGVVPVAPVDAVGPVAGVDGGVVVADVVAHLQQQGDGKLADRGGAVGGHVGDGDALFGGVDVVHHVVAGGQHGNHFHAGAGVDDLFGDGGLVGKHHLRVPDAGDGLVLVGEAGAVIDRQLSQLPQLVPAQVAGIFGISVQYYDFHEIYPPDQSFCGLNSVF